MDLPAGSQADAGVTMTPGETTGAFLVLFADDEVAAGVAALRDRAGVAAPEHVRGSEVGIDDIDRAAAVVFDDLGVAVVAAEPDQERGLLAAVGTTPAVIHVEPERVVGILDGDALGVEYLRGYRDAVDHLLRTLESGAAAGIAAGTAAEWDESQLTWGLQATAVGQSCYTGRGVRVAVLDTGVDRDHRDLAARSVTARSFVAGEDADDGHGHGTHCVGTACGTNPPAVLPRYGVASEAEIFAGKVLSNAGRGADRGILAGISWAMESGCRVVSMSLGAPVEPGAAFSRVFERAASRALAKGCVIVAAAGNDSARPATARPVSHPANCPSILAVAALTPDLGVARFSNAGLNADGGQIDLGGPGVGVRSSWPEPSGYRVLNGTSMATPHVAGVLALLAEQRPEASAAELKTLLLQLARRLPLPSVDVGAGIVQAP